ncbi:MAG: rod shape-determining protein MreD [Candidatus Eisenbacteria bacterium]|nr:rod shape-determining protein MreD [Candidatus Eisenbacteria bacterium]
MALFVARLVLTLWAVLTFRLTLGPSLAIAGVQPDLAAALVFYIALARGATFGIIGGFLMGLLVDVDHPLGLGVSSLAWSTMSLVVSRLSEAIDTRDPVLGSFLLFLAVLLAETVKVPFIGGYDPSRFALVWLRWSLPTALYTAVAVPLLVAGAHAVMGEKRWLGGRS